MERRKAMSAGKGDSPRPVNAEVYGQHYEDIFRKDKPQPTPQPTPPCNTTEK
jgi:hypothetical protein